jgi:hypothetical protein
VVEGRDLSDKTIVGLLYRVFKPITVHF